jgi:hypothetical protein
MVRPAGGGGTPRGMKKLLFAMAIGAALAWLFDPDSGSRRRDSMRRKLEERRGTIPATSVPPAAAGVVQDAPTLRTAAH